MQLSMCDHIHFSLARQRPGSKKGRHTDSLTSSRMLLVRLASHADRRFGGPEVSFRILGECLFCAFRTVSRNGQPNYHTKTQKAMSSVFANFFSKIFPPLFIGARSASLRRLRGPGMTCAEVGFPTCLGIVARRATKTQAFFTPFRKFFSPRAPRPAEHRQRNALSEYGTKERLRCPCSRSADARNADRPRQTAEHRKVRPLTSSKPCTRCRQCAPTIRALPT